MSDSVSGAAGTGGTEDEVARLREDVSRLEAQLAETEAWASRAVADAQAKTYWLDRWGIDLNAIMERPAADRARAWARRLRSLYRSAARLRRRVGS
jgi:hypothetical protein